MNDANSGAMIIELAAELTGAWLQNPNNTVSAEELPGLISGIYAALAGLGADKVENTAVNAEYTPAVTVRRSLASPDHIISMIDGKPYKMLKRHLGLNGLTPQQYRERYNLKSDYPMVAESYAAKRRDLAMKNGLGRKPGTKVAAAGPKAKAVAPATDTPGKAPAKAKAAVKAKAQAKPKKLGLFNGSSAETTDLA